MRIMYIAYNYAQADRFLCGIAKKLNNKGETVAINRAMFEVSTNKLNLIAVPLNSPKSALIGYPQPDYVCNCGYPDKYVSNKHYECIEQKIRHIKTRFQESVKYITEQELKEIIGVV